MELKIVDIVVTYNRKHLLKENIDALLQQSYSNHTIMIVDNASSDGTNELVYSYNSDRIIYYNTGDNLGGAGGFCYGMRKALEGNYDYAWIMDDDSIPTKDALSSIVSKMQYIDEDFSFIASLVYWTDGKIFPMNCPSSNAKKVADADYDLIRRAKLLTINRGSFVGCFINLSVARKVGLPISKFFIYGDDLEYTGRLRRYGKAFLDLDSIIIHKAPSNKGADVVTAEEDRIDRFFYQYRNGMYIARKEKGVLKRIAKVSKDLAKVVVYSDRKKMKRLGKILSGSFCGLFFNPDIEYIS